MHRAACLATAALLVLVVLELAFAAPVEHYDLALVGSVQVATAVAAWRLWTASTLPARVATGALVGMTLVGQVLASSLGGPGTVQPQWHPVAVVVVLVAVAALSLVAAMPVASEASSGERPYAL